MKSIKDKAIEYAKTKHTNQNLIEIVSWDFEAGANYVLDEIEKLLPKDGKPLNDTGKVLLWRIKDTIEQLKGELPK